MELLLPTSAGALERYALRASSPIALTAGARFNRIAYSAAHVVADPRAAVDPWLQCAIDWDATIAYRRRLWSLGLGVAEAMDTAQRGMGLDWPTTQELIRRALAEARACGATDLIGSTSIQRRSFQLLSAHSASCTPLAPSSSVYL